jgi:DNA replicative helicase MCM subunit Mcm2 (Cdc46/Mcm family)
MTTGRQISDGELLLVETSLKQLAEWRNLSDEAEAEEGSGTSEKAKFIEHCMKALRGLSGHDWTTVDYGKLLEVCRRKNIGKPVKIRGSMRSMSNVMPCFEIDGEMDTIEVEMADDEGDTIDTLRIADPILLNKVQQSFGAFHSFDFVGSVVPAKPESTRQKDPIYKFFLVDIEPSENPLQMVRATQQEIKDVEILVKQLSAKPGAIIDHIRDQLIRIIGIQGLEDATLLDRSLSFMVLQALSDGYDARRSFSHKLHSLIIGSPAVGKKLLCEAAHILNPICTEAQPAKITVAGIAGKAVKKEGAWTSEPGLIPLAHRGTFVVQDFHHVERKTEIMGVLSMAMEDGRVIDSTAANKEHHALTSIHIDMNKQSDISLADKASLDTPQARLADLGVTMNVLTRFDYIVNIPRDTMRQMEIALQMHTGSQKTTRYPGKRKHSEESRKLQVLVAFLRTRYDEIEISEDLAQEHIRAKQEELLDKNREQLEKRTLLGDYQTRLSNSVHKLTFAIARANARSTATESDVDEAFRFVKTKLDFLKTIEDFDVPDTWNHVPLQEKVKKRLAFIRKQFGGSEVPVAVVLKSVIEKLDKQVSESTIRRDLEKVGEKRKHGYYWVRGDQPGEMTE